MSKSYERGPDHGPSRGFQPLMAVLVTIYLVFAVALAHTAYVALQGRNTAALGLEASSSSASAFRELKEQIAELKQHVQQAQLGLAAANNASSDQMQQLKQQLIEQLQQPLHNTTQAAASLLQHAARVDERITQLQSHVNTINTKIAPPPAVPVGVRVEDKELHHIATHQAVCDKRGASGLTLNVTDELIAPLVIVGHNRPGYLARSIMTLMK